MAYRSPKRSSGRQLKPSQVLPIWTPANTNAANIVVKELLAHLGITDLRTYFHQLRVAIAICAIAGACIGVSVYDTKGLILGALIGVATPAALIWLGVVLTMIVIFLAAYCLACVAIWFVAMWILHS
jgi:hypothetical protein